MNRAVYAGTFDPMTLGHLDVAARAPSGTNTQPWKVYVLTGQARERLCDAIERVNAEVNGAIKEPATAQRIRELGAVPTGGTPEDLGEFLKNETEKWKRVIEAAGIVVE